MKANLLAVLLFGIVAVSLVSCDSDADELTALTRDGLSRKNPDELLGGFFPAWAAILYTLAASSLAMAIIGFLGYAFGICQKPNPEYDTYVA